MKKIMPAVVAVLALLLGATKSAHAIYDGTPSTGSFTIATNASLAAASATGSIVIVDTISLRGAKVTIGPYAFVAGRDFVIGTTTSTAASSLVSAINASQASVTAAYADGDASIALTALGSGTRFNAVSLVTSDTDEMTVSGATLTGGLDNAYVSINAIQLVQGRDFFKQDVSSNTAINLAAAINLNPILHTQVEAVWLGGSSSSVYLRAAVSPVAYKLATSGSPITKSGTAMTGGAAGNLARSICDIGSVNSLPTSNYPAGCRAILISSGAVYVSTEAVVGSQSWAIAIVGQAGTSQIAPGAVDTTKLAAGAVDTNRLNRDAVVTAKILDANVTLAKLASASVDTTKLLGGATDTNKIACIRGNGSFGKCLAGSIINSDCACGPLTTP